MCGCEDGIGNLPAAAALQIHPVVQQMLFAFWFPPHVGGVKGQTVVFLSTKGRDAQDAHFSSAPGQMYGSGSRDTHKKNTSTTISLDELNHGMQSGINTPLVVIPGLQS